MVLHHEAIFQNRKHAAFLLGERLMEYQDTDAVVIAISGGGIHIGSYLAQLLHLPLEVIPSKKIKHPADSNKTIGAVCAETVVFHDDNNIPQDYIYHQIQILQHIIKGQTKIYNYGHAQVSIKNKTVILADDLLKTGDTMLACLKTIRKQQPRNVIVAVPNMTPEGARAIVPEIDGVICLTIEPNLQAAGDLYEDFPAVGQEEVITFLQRTRSEALVKV